VVRLRLVRSGGTPCGKRSFIWTAAVSSIEDDK
jgi:hypothetical protein